jgi:hypothetical protein
MRKPPWETARGRVKIVQGLVGALWPAHRRSRSPSGYLDIWSFKDSDTKFVRLVNSVPCMYPRGTFNLKRLY